MTVRVQIELSDEEDKIVEVYRGGQYVWSKQSSPGCHSDHCRYTHTHIPSFTGVDSRYLPDNLGRSHAVRQEMTGS
jgi:hypothetical protein